MNYSREIIKTNNIYLDVLIIFIFAVLIRVILFYLFDFQRDLHGGDSSYYLEIGHNILQYGVHGDKWIGSFYRPPLYSLFAGLVAKTSETAIFFYVIQSALFIGVSFVVFFFYFKYNSNLAFYSSLLIAFSPFDALLNGRVLGENLATPFILISALSFISSKYSIWSFMLSGVTLGCAVLCRDIFILLPLLYVLVCMFMKIKIKYISFYLLGFFLLVVPWAYRNSQMPNGGVFLSKGIMWQNLWVGTWMRNTDFMFKPGYLPPEALQTYDEGKSPAIVMEAYRNNDQSFFKQATLQYVAKHPIKVIETWIIRYPRLWFGTRSDLISTNLIKGSLIWYSIKIFFYLLSALIVLLGASGMFISLQSKQISVLFTLPVIYSALIYIPFYNVETRYTQPVMPILSIYAVLCISYILKNKSSLLRFNIFNK